MTTATTIAEMPRRRTSFIEDRVVTKPFVNSTTSLPLDDRIDVACPSRGLVISESTRRILKSMGESQVREAKVSLAAVKQRRSSSSKLTKVTGSKRLIEDYYDSNSSEEETRRQKKEKFIPAHSMGVPKNDKEEHHEEDNGEKFKASVKGVDETVSQLTRTTASEPNSQPNSDWEPQRLNMVKSRRRKKGSETMSFTAANKIQNPNFKLISSSMTNVDYFNGLQSDGDDDYDNERKGSPSKMSGWGLGGVWNKLTSSLSREISEIIFDADDTDSTMKASPIAKPKKRIDVRGVAQASAPYDYYIVRGKKKANKGQYLQAVALYNLALIRQREDLNVDNIECATTLYEIGTCWMILSENVFGIECVQRSAVHTTEASGRWGPGGGREYK